MKTTAKLSLLAAAFLLVLASCTNNLTWKIKMIKCQRQHGSGL